ncbi:MAG: hypothetical protein HY367_02160 [Candidatus Aenigmarchaeota archaeon]|nr:hypothetical protein [Candidatus Aenigmarchaeota archaeon]
MRYTHIGRLTVKQCIDNNSRFYPSRKAKSTLGQVRLMPLVFFLLVLPVLILAQGTENSSLHPEGFLIKNADPVDYPVLDIDISAPENLTRGGTATITASVRNAGAADVSNVRFVVSLPEGIEVVIGESEKKCGLLLSGDSCTNEIVVSTSTSTALGPNTVRVKVLYG